MSGLPPDRRPTGPSPSDPRSTPTGKHRTLPPDRRNPLPREPVVRLTLKLLQRPQEVLPVVLRVERHPVRRQRRQVVDLPEPRVQLRAPQPRVRQLVLVHEKQHRDVRSNRGLVSARNAARSSMSDTSRKSKFATNLPHPLRQQLRPQTHPPPPLPPRQRQQLQVVPPMPHQPLRERTVAPPKERLHEQPTRPCGKATGLSLSPVSLRRKGGSSDASRSNGLAFRGEVVSEW